MDIFSSVLPPMAGKGEYCIIDFFWWTNEEEKRLLCHAMKVCECQKLSHIASNLEM